MSVKQELAQAADFAPAQRILEKLGISGGRGGGLRSSEQLIPLLQDLQDEYGFLPPDILQQVSRQSGIPTSRMFGVITFYTNFHLKPRGRHTVRCCTGTACHVNGAGSVSDVLTKELGVRDGGTTKDLKYSYETVNCLGTCFLAPVVMVNEDYYGELTATTAAEILKRYD